jgi:hypothetical protein
LVTTETSLSQNAFKAGAKAVDGERRDEREIVFARHFQCQEKRLQIL